MTRMFRICLFNCAKMAEKLARLPFHPHPVIYQGTHFAGIALSHPIHQFTECEIFLDQLDPCRIGWWLGCWLGLCCIPGPSFHRHQPIASFALFELPGHWIPISPLWWSKKCTGKSHFARRAFHLEELKQLRRIGCDPRLEPNKNHNAWRTKTDGIPNCNQVWRAYGRRLSQ